MSSAFQYKPRFKDMRVKPPKPEEEAAEADVLHLKPGEKPCQWPDCRMPATARAPKSRERLNDFYDFCQRHAGEYNKGWNFYAGMSEGEVRAAQENEAMTGGRPTWEMKAGKFTREAAAFAAKFGTGPTFGMTVIPVACANRVRANNGLGPNGAKPLPSALKSWVEA